MFKQPNSFDHLVDAAFSHRTIVPVDSPSQPVDITAHGESAPVETEGSISDLDPEETRSHCVETATGEFWVAGNTVLCACPDCSASHDRAYLDRTSRLLAMRLCNRTDQGAIDRGPTSSRKPDNAALPRAASVASSRSGPEYVDRYRFTV